MASSSLPWTRAEEITLCVAWCNAMYTYGVTRKGFWEDVFANFKEDIGGTVRGYDVIVSKWKNSIRPKVAAFSVVYDGVQRMDENGSSDLFLFQNALAEYQTRYRHPFTMEASMDKKSTQSNPSTPEKPPMSPISSIPTIEEKADEHEICPYLTEEEYQQLVVDEAAFKEHLKEEAKAEKERAIADKELEEFMKVEQAHDELSRMEFGMKSDSEYETY
ncbi:hypothetical protein Tco_1392988 [Tanacetum coccineum]